MNSVTLFYIHDPMCSWCWGFNNTWEKVKELLPSSINIQYILGGLAPDNDKPMSIEMRKYIQTNWRRIEREIPGVKFNNDFWSNCTPKRSTYPACRTVIAVKNQNPELEQTIIKLIQKAYYVDAKDPSKDDVLILLAKTLNINIKQFISDLNSDQTQKQLLDDIDLIQTLGVGSFPSLVLKTKEGLKPIDINYNDENFILTQIIT